MDLFIGQTTKRDVWGVQLPTPLRKPNIYYIKMEKVSNRGLWVGVGGVYVTIRTLVVELLKNIFQPSEAFQEVR